MKFNVGDRVRATHDYTKHNMGTQSYVGMVYATDMGQHEPYGIVIFEPESNMRYPCMTFAESDLKLLARAVYMTPPRIAALAEAVSDATYEPMVRNLGEMLSESLSH